MRIMCLHLPDGKSTHTKRQSRQSGKMHHVLSLHKFLSPKSHYAFGKRSRRTVPVWEIRLDSKKFFSKHKEALTCSSLLCIFDKYIVHGRWSPCRPRNIWHISGIGEDSLDTWCSLPQSISFFGEWMIGKENRDGSFWRKLPMWMSFCKIYLTH